MSYQEIPMVFNCEEHRLVGIIAKPHTSSPTGVLIVVGGPQYRAGSHRQFTLLARELARNGYPSCRFDYRGMGDSEGEMRTFETVDEDIKAAIDAFLATVEDVEQIVIWGLCDAASATLYYAHTDCRVKGLVLLNPWVHNEASEGRMRIKHYYLARLIQKSFWAKLFSGRVSVSTTIVDFFKSVGFFFAKNNHSPCDIAENSLGNFTSYIGRMLSGLKLYPGNVLFVLSENDLVAQEFGDLLRTEKAWNSACQSSKIEQRFVPKANHTFSSRAWRDQAANLTLEWLQKLMAT